MADTISFFTPIAWSGQPKSWQQEAAEIADDLFYLWGKKAYVFDETNEQTRVVISDGSSYISTLLKIVLFVTGIIPLIALIIKAVSHYSRTFQVIDPEQELIRDWQIPELLQTRLQTVIPKVTSRLVDRNDPAIEYLKGFRVFRLREFPQFIVKTELMGNDSIQRRYENTVQGKAICLAHRLDQLYIPKAALFRHQGGWTYTIEESLDIHPAASVQEEFFDRYRESLDLAIQQLAFFILKKKNYDDVASRNNPVLDTNPEHQGPRRIALIDLEGGQDEDGEAGIYYGATKQEEAGLIKALFDESQIWRVVAQAQRAGVAPPNVEQIVQQRLAEIASRQELLQSYYTPSHFNDERQPIQVDYDHLELDLNEVGTFDVMVAGKWQQETMTMRQAVEVVVGKINTWIAQAPSDFPIQGKRLVRLDQLEDVEIQPIYKLGKKVAMIVSKENEERSWLYRIINALAKQKSIFKLKEANPYGFYVQA